jgi:uncharacterized protein
VKILAVSDEVVDFLYSPRIKDRYSDVDLVLGCGDVPYYYLEFLVTMLNVPLFYVAGNHDQKSQYLSDGRIIQTAEGCEPLDGHVVRLGRESHVPALAGAATPLLLAGLGGSMRYNNHGINQYSEPEMTTRAARLAPALLMNRLRYGRFLDILVTHSPPYGIHDEPDLAHTGFRAFRRMMDVFRPGLLLHGHAHVYRADAVTHSLYKDTQVINVYPYRLLEWNHPADD